jgi:tetratricopeptide (TPR) repeat protein
MANEETGTGKAKKTSKDTGDQAGKSGKAGMGAKASEGEEAGKAPPPTEVKAAGGEKGDGIDASRARLSAAGRNDACPCGSGKKYKKCHLIGDETATAPVPEAPDARKTLANAWALFEQRRPGAAEREFRAALALDATLVDARVGIGMARLSASDLETARAELGAVVKDAEPEFEKLRSEKVTDAFTRPEVQPIIRAAHALGCLAYDQERYDEAIADLERVFSIDNGAVGTEARLIAGKSRMKQGKPAEAITLLEPAVTAETGGARAQMGLALAHFASGDEAKARTALTAALAANPHFGKAVLGRIRRHVENVAGTQPGTVEEALVYSQTYGDAWTDDAKAFLTKALDEASAKPAAKPAAEAPEAPPAAP